MRTNLVIVENGKFIFDTNFAGDPKKDRFGSDERKPIWLSQTLI